MKEKEQFGASGSGITLSTKLVTAGHARKMREAKDLTKKSAEDMAAIFGVRVEEYQNTSVWGRLSSLSAGETSTDAQEEKKEEALTDMKLEKKERKKKDKKKRKKKDKNNEDSDDGNRKRRKKTRTED